jgi:hypothetical protein
MRGGVPISLEDRWFNLGATGTGKTTFNKKLMDELLRLYPGLQAYVLDTKQYRDFLDWAPITAQSSPPKPLPFGGAQRKLTWQPVGRDLDAIDAWFQQLFDLPYPVVINVDEMLGILRKKGGDPPYWFSVIQTAGRAKGKLAITNSQELSYMPGDVVKQATHVVAFRTVGKMEPLQRNLLLRRNNRGPLPNSRYGFAHLRLDDPMAEAVDYTDWQEFLRRAA